MHIFVSRLLLGISRWLRVSSVVWILISNVVVNAHAAIVSGLNEASVVVSDQSQRTQDTAMQQALRDVLVKISGSDALLESADIRRAVRQAESLLNSFRFESRDGQLIYHATFNEQKVEELVKSSGFPIWGMRRPDSLIWLAYEEPNGQKGGFERRLVNDFSASTIKQWLIEAATKRAIPVAFPLMDLTDVQQISVYDVWGRFVERIDTASQRYQPDYVLAARMYDVRNLTQQATVQTQQLLAVNRARSAFSQDEFTAMGSDEAPIIIEWTLLTQRNVQFGELSATTHEAAITELIDNLADVLASRYALDTENLLMARNQLDIKITNVDSLDKYVAISEFLDSLTLVDSAMIRTQQGNQAIFALDMMGSQDDLLNAIRLDSRLQRVVDEFGRATDELNFIWMP
ncbi:DUF2066 domain-containing protein [Aestuariibacter salexigens]|uniref:DUF2066 domain-containing protein n=1 Tax=Aestuariibacter salexigens TaxID=226010 RepID=UPI000A01461D|nr:DUF2066 domain-containing protein [Aestuariibacter salexigens]